MQRFVRRGLVLVLGLAALVCVLVGTEAPVSAQAVTSYNGVTVTYPGYSYPGLYNYGYNYAYGYAPYAYAYNNVYTPVYGYTPYANNYSYAYAPYYGNYSYGYGIPPRVFTRNGCKVGNYSCLFGK